MKRKIIAWIIATSMAVSSALYLLPNKAENVLAADSIVCDGDSSDWAGIASQGSSNSAISDWKIAVSNDYVYMYVAQNPLGYYGEAIGGTRIDITYNDSQYYNANYSAINIQQIWTDQSGIYGVADAWGQAISGGKVVFEGQNTNYDIDSAFAEVAIPRSWFPSEDFTLTYAGKTMNSENIVTINGAKQLKKQEENPGYGNGESSQPSTEEPATDEPSQGDASDQPESGNSSGEGNQTKGIVIDGNFSDWDFVQKTQNPAPALKEGAAIWDGDNIYLYLREQDWWDGCATMVGFYNNGNYCIELSDGTKTSVMISKDGAFLQLGQQWYELDHQYKDHQYEISVPVNKLQGYNSKITSMNFGIMTNETPIYITQGCVNQSPKIDPDQTTEGKLKKITYDYDFSDWEGYQKTNLHYSTAGGNGADSVGALYSDGDILFGYVDYYGGYYDDAFNHIALRVNDKSECINFTLRGVDSNGNVQQWNQATYLGPGEYEYYIFDNAYVGKATNINNPWTFTYGRAYIRVDETGRAQMEYYIDIPTLVKVTNLKPEEWGAYNWKLDQSDIKTFHVNYIRIGWQWVSCAGTSTGPIVGILLCLAVVVAAEIYRKRRTGSIGS